MGKDAEEAVKTVASRQGEKEKVTTLSTGIRAKILPVSASLIDEVTARVRDPKVPMWHDEEKGRDEPNPNDPNYQDALQDAQRERGVAAMDAMIMFGVELVDPMPEDDKWIKRLKFVGVDVDNSDEIAKEFSYKKHIAVGAADLKMLTAASGITEEDIAEAERTFQR